MNEKSYSVPPITPSLQLASDGDTDDGELGLALGLEDGDDEGDSLGDVDGLV